MIRINLGSGFIGLNSWINYDNSILAKIDRFIPIRWLAFLKLIPAEYKTVKFPKIRVRNIKKGLPHKDNSVDCVYTSHFLEHLHKWETKNVLKECHRVLKDGGVIRVSVPDIDKIIRLKDPDDINYWFYPWYLNLTKPSLYCLIKEFFLRHHKWMYNFKSMREMLREAGFTDIRKKRVYDSQITDAKRLDTYPKISVFVEARKTIFEPKRRKMGLKHNSIAFLNARKRGKKRRTPKMR